MERPGLSRGEFWYTKLMKRKLALLGASGAIGTAVYLSLLILPRKLESLSRQGGIDLQVLSGTFDPQTTTAFYDNRLVFPPPFSAEEDQRLKSMVLGETSVPKLIAINLTQQQLYAFEGNQLVYSFPVSSGKWGKTPTGIFRIWVKLRYTVMQGGSKALGTYYYLPNVPYTMYFYSQEVPQTRGFGIHGTYWHNNFGHPMSHGCVNMKTEDVGQLFYWANPRLGDQQSIWASEDNPGTMIFIYGTAPSK